MKLFAKILLFIAICNLFVSCGTTKTKRSAATKTTVATVQTATIKENFTVETKYYGDTLKGTMPLPELTEKPTLITVESGGQKLALAITKNSVTYKSIPKHIATVTKNSVKETDTKAVADAEQVLEVKEVKIQKPWRPPWWWYVVAVGVAVAIYLIITKPLSFKTILKTILKIFN